MCVCLVQKKAAKPQKNNNNKIYKQATKPKKGSKATKKATKPKKASKPKKIKNLNMTLTVAASPLARVGNVRAILLTAKATKFFFINVCAAMHDMKDE